MTKRKPLLETVIADVDARAPDAEATPAKEAPPVPLAVQVARHELGRDLYGAMGLAETSDDGSMFAKLAEAYADGDPSQVAAWKLALSKFAPRLAMAVPPGEASARLARETLALYASPTGTRARAYRLSAAYEVLGERGDGESAARLAEALLGRLTELSNRITLFGTGRPEPRLGDGLAAALMRPRDPAAPPARDGMLLWDAELADVLETVGEEGQRAAEALRAASRQRWRDKVEPDELWRRWLYEVTSGPSDSHGTDDRFTPAVFRILTLALWRDDVGRSVSAAPMSMSVVSKGGDEHAKLQKFAASMSWAFGAPGTRVKVDNDEYATTPNIATKLVPRTYALLPADHAKRPHQTSLPLDYGDVPEVLPVAMTDATQYAISPVGAKVAILVLADQVLRGGQLSRVQLGEIAARVHPLAKRIQPRELEASARALDELRRLFLYLPDGTKVQVFDVQSPQRPKGARADMSLCLGLTRSMMAAMTSLLATDDGPGRSYKGEFIVNMSGLMRLPNKQPALLRHAMRAAAHWNAAFNPLTRAFDPNRLRTYSIEDWAVMTNSLAPAVADYLRAGRRGPDRRRQLSQETKRISGELAELAEEHRLIRLEKKGSKLVILPPDTWREAREQMRKVGGRPQEQGG